MVTTAAATGRRFALLLALRDSEYAKTVYRGYHNVFVSAFGSGDERWDSFRVVDGEFPAEEELPRYDGFVISGSPSDAYGDAPWIRRLCLLVQTLHAMRKRVLGVCFGHQVLCRALGGRVGKSRTGGWDVGVRKVTFANDLTLDHLACASIVEVHQDEVWEVPRGARVLAYSDKTRVEAFVVGDHALGVQGHPEYGLDILHNLIDRLTNDGSIPRRLADDARSSVTETGGPDRAFWTGLCKGFLRGGGVGKSGSRPAAAIAAAAATAPEVIMASSSRAATVAAGCFVEAPMLHQLACSAGIN